MSITLRLAYAGAIVVVAVYLVVATICIFIAIAADAIWHDLTTPYERYPERRQ